MARMDSTLFAQYSAPQQFTFVSAEMYAQGFPASPAMSHASSSFGRSPAQQTHSLPVASPRHFYSTYDQPAGEVFSEDDFSSASSACSNGVETHYQYTTATAVATYGGESIPRNITWAKEEPVEYTTIPRVALESQLPNGVYAEVQATYPSYFESVAPEIASYYDEEALAQESQLSAYTVHHDTLPVMVHNFSQSPQIVHAHLEREQPSSTEPTYSVAEPARLHYVPEPQEPPSQFVSPQDVSPSPVVSPDPAYSTLPAGSPAAVHYVVAQPATPSPATPSPATPAPSTHDDYAAACETPTPKPARKRRRVASDDEDYAHASDSGESEKDESDDDEYRPAAREGLRRRRRSSARAAPAPPQVLRDASPSELLLPRLAPPVPVPNLTKKSRGRQVPTSAVLVRHNGVEKNVRSYKCKVPGCSKYFQRGEHLKRHVRSIHTNEKPHKCPYRACGKDFSRHDNLRQHMRVHRNDRLDSEETSGSG